MLPSPPSPLPSPDFSFPTNTNPYFTLVPMTNHHHFAIPFFPITQSTHARYDYWSPPPFNFPGPPLLRSWRSMIRCYRGGVQPRLRGNENAGVETCFSFLGPFFYFTSSRSHLLLLLFPLYLPGLFLFLLETPQSTVVKQRLRIFLGGNVAPHVVSAEN